MILQRGRNPRKTSRGGQCIYLDVSLQKVVPSFGYLMIICVFYTECLLSAKSQACSNLKNRDAEHADGPLPL